MGVGIGANLLIDWNDVELTTQTASLPGNIYIGAFGNYKQNVLPMVDVFAQAGFLFKLFDVEKELEKANSSVATTLIDLSKIDRSGIFYRVGVSIGF